ncbi:hypothetical protein B0H10DRAFT_1281147 [Mycena sp. CBHHK59/15]|nr:hypothetical protein B0H10DRAFT_1281147 [Mycena sp. CBHHK59/15]
MAGLLRKLTPSKTTLLSFVVTLGYLIARHHYGPNNPAFQYVHAFLAFALTSFLYIVIAFGLFTALSQLVIIPLLSFLAGDDESAEETEGSTESDMTSRQPHDEESLPVEDSRGNSENTRGLRGWWSRTWPFLVLASLILPVASSLRPKGTPFFIGSFQVITRVGKFSGIALAVIFAPLLVPSVPLLIVWTIVKRLTIEPYKTSWYRIVALSNRTINGAFLYLLVLEGVSLHGPPSFTVVQRLAWQATPLSLFFKWFGICAYAAVLIWVLTDRTALYLLNRTAHKLNVPKNPPAPVPLYQVLILLAQYVLLPISMVLNGYVYTSRSRASETLIPATIVLAWTTLGVFAVFLFDLFVYWMYFFCGARRSSNPIYVQEPETAQGSEIAPEAESESSKSPPVPDMRNGDWSNPLDVIGLSIFGFAVRDKDGKTIWDQQNEKLAEERQRSHKPDGDVKSELDREGIDSSERDKGNPAS